jgi:hypothetical protein
MGNYASATTNKGVLVVCVIDDKIISQSETWDFVQCVNRSVAHRLQFPERPLSGPYGYFVFICFQVLLRSVACLEGGDVWGAYRCFLFYGFFQCWFSSWWKTEFDCKAGKAGNRDVLMASTLARLMIVVSPFGVCPSEKQLDQNSSDHRRSCQHYSRAESAFHVWNSPRHYLHSSPFPFNPVGENFPLCWVVKFSCHPHHHCSHAHIRQCSSHVFLVPPSGTRASWKFKCVSQ